jgi:hypothetical protein
MIELLKTYQKNIYVVSIRSVQRWVFAYLENGTTTGLKIKKTGSSLQSHITEMKIKR